ncbi:PTS sugar transporter subunit IIA [bacterium]|nr:PTS sugar transporter subunit IIA [bacterium]MBU1753231.1 PTS sugar transporter subunit IIA [bacterium]
MKLSDMLSIDVVEADLKAKDKNGVIEELVDLLIKTEKITQRDKVIAAVLAREDMMTTGIGHGVAIPHAKSDKVNNIDETFNKSMQGIDMDNPIIVVAFGRSVQGIEFGAADGVPVHLFFLLIASGEGSSLHIKALARISRLLKHHYIRELLKKAKDAESMLEILKTEEAKRLE